LIIGFKRNEVSLIIVRQQNINTGDEYKFGSPPMFLYPFLKEKFNNFSYAWNVKVKNEK